MGVNGIEYAAKSIAGMIEGRTLPWVQDNFQQSVWESWEVYIRDLFVLDKHGAVVDVVNLTALDPDPTVNEGENYRALKELLLTARDQQ